MNLTCGMILGIAVISLATAFGLISSNSLQDVQSENGFKNSEIMMPSLNTTVQPIESETAFKVQDDVIMYGHSDTLDCQYVIGGQVFDWQGEPLLEDIAVAVDMIEIEELTESAQVTYKFPGDDPERGESGWSAVLVNWDVNYLVWLERVSTNEVISPKVIVETQDCENNLAIMNFVQNLP